MKTRTRKTTRVLCASAVAMMTLLSSAAPAFAVTEAKQDPINLKFDNGNLKFDKKIYLDENENTPYVTIGYTLSGRDVDKKTDEYKNLNEYGNVKTGNNDINIDATTFDEESPTGNSNTGKYVYEETSIPTTNMVDGLTAPTVLTYTLSEKVSNSFITTDTNKGKTRKLNVYVGYAKKNDGTYASDLSVLYATLADESGNKSVGFENNYDTQAIHLTKKVTGNQGDKTKKFTFTVNIANQYSKVTASGTKTGLDESKLTPDNHNVSFTVNLADSDTLYLKGLSKGATYTVTENAENYTQESATVNGKTPNTTLDNARAITDDEDTVVFTNKKEGTIPTGIYLNHKLPFNIAGIAILGGAISLVAKKRHDALAEDDDE